MNKFFAFIGAVLALCMLATSPASANNPWEPGFTKATRHQDGTWTASVTINQTGVKVTKRFAECEPIPGRKWRCRNQIQGAAPTVANNDNGASVTANNCRNTRSTTCYAVFHPQHYTRYISNGGNIWNTQQEPQMVGVCRSAGSHCTFEEAPLHDYAAANNAVKRRTNWPLQWL